MSTYWDQLRSDRVADRHLPLPARKWPPQCPECGASRVTTPNATACYRCGTDLPKLTTEN